MFKVDILYKKYFREKEKQRKKSMKRMTSITKRELKRSTKRFRKDAVIHLKKNTGLKLTQGEVFKKYTKLNFYNLKEIKYMTGVASFSRRGINLIYFVVGRIKASKQKGIPIRKRKSPYVQVYKGQKTKLKKAFIIKKKNEAGTHVLLRRTDKNKLRSPRTPSIVHLLKKTGFNLEEKAQRERMRMLIKILKNKKWIFEPMTKKN